MNIVLPLLVLLVMYEATHYGIKKIGEVLVPESLKKFLIFNADAVEILGLIFRFIIWILKFYLLASVVEFVAVDFTGGGSFQITSFNEVAQLVLGSVTLDFIKGVFSNISSKKTSESKNINAELKHGELI